MVRSSLLQLDVVGDGTFCRIVGIRTLVYYGIVNGCSHLTIDVEDSAVSTDCCRFLYYRSTVEIVILIACVGCFQF